MENKNRRRHGGRHDNLFEKLRGWRLAVSIDGEAIARGAVIALLLVFFSLLQTTLFTTFSPFGVVPDLILPLVIAVAMTERHKWGGVFGVIAAFVIESIGGSRLTILPLLYMPAGDFVGILRANNFRDTFATRALFTVVSSFVRAIFSLIIIFSTLGGVTLPSALMTAVIPEFFANIIFAIIPHAAAKLALSPFNKSRDDRIG